MHKTIQLIREKNDIIINYTKILYAAAKMRVGNVHIIIDKRGGILYNKNILNESCTIIY